MLRVKNKPVHWIIVPNILDGNICGNCDEEGFGLRKVCPVGGFIMCGRFQQNCNKAIQQDLSHADLKTTN